MTNSIKTILAAVFLLFALMPARAQKHFQPNIAVGGKAGVTLSKVNFSPGVKQGWNMGQTAGATFRYMEEKHFGLIVEALITRAGWKENFEDARFNYSRTLTYLQLPILTHIYFGNNRFRGFFNMGPRIGFALSESTDANLNGTNPSPNRPDTQHELPIQKKFDWGLCGGPGIELRTPIGYFLLEGRFNLSLSNIYNSHKGDTFSKSANQVITAKLTYLIPLK